MSRVADATVAPPGAVEFRFSVWRYVAAMLIIMPLAYALSLLLMAGLLAPTPGAFADYLGPFSLGQTALVLLVGAVVATVSTARRPPWVRVSDLGIEIARTQGEPTFVPWPAVAAVAFRQPGVFTVMYLSVTGLDAVSIASRGGWLPRFRTRAGWPTTRVEAGMLRPGVRELRAEIERRRPAWPADRRRQRQAR